MAGSPKIELTLCTVRIVETKEVNLEIKDQSAYASRTETEYSTSFLIIIFVLLSLPLCKLPQSPSTLPYPECNGELELASQTTPPLSVLSPTT